MHTDAGRMLANRLRVLGRLYASLDLPAAVGAARLLAYRNAFLIAACDHYRAGERAAGAAAMRHALDQQPGLVADPTVLRRLHRWLLPVGSQSEAMVQSRWRPLTAIVRQMLIDALGDRPRGLRWRAELAYWRTAVRLARKAWAGPRRSDGDAIPAVEPDRA